MLNRTMKLMVLVLLVGLLASCAPASAASGGASSGATATTGNAATTGGTPAAGGNPLTLILGAYSTPREAYGQIIPLFKAKWKKETGQDVEFQESYLGSGAQ